MKDREKIIRYYQGSDNGELAARLIDLADSVAKGKPYRVSEFLSPLGLQIAETIQAQGKGLELTSYGGYEGAERIRIAFSNPDYVGDIDFGICACKITWDARYRMIGHRDILGSLIGLGIDRSRFGDIIVKENSAIVLTDAALLAYLQQHLVKISIVRVEIEEVSLDELAPREEKVKEIRTTVASLRLDAIASSGFGLSRTKTVEAIKGDRLQVNWLPAKGPAQEVGEGDIISFRGRGRMEVAQITGQSRKGRIGVLLKRYI